MKKSLLGISIGAILCVGIFYGTVKISQYIDFKKQEREESIQKQRAYDSVQKFYKQCMFTYQYGFLRPQPLCNCLTNKLVDVLGKDFIEMSFSWKEGTGITSMIDKVPQNKRNDFSSAISFCDHMQAMTRAW